MLNKDEYNQEEYNDYYRQETQGAELNDSGNDESGGMGKVIGLIVLIALAVAGYFGYKIINSSNDDIDTSLQVSMDTLPQSMQSQTKIENSNEHTQKEQVEVKEKEKSTIVKSTPEVEVEVKEESNITKSTPEVEVEAKEESNITKSTPEVEVEEKEESTIATNKQKVETKQETPKEKTVQNEVSDKVQQAIGSSKSKMSPEEVATIVAAVMKQISQEKDNSTKVDTDVTQKDKELMNTLSTTEVDSVSNDLENALENVDINEQTHIDNNKKQVDVYNKVNVQDAKGTDSLSQLSAQITNEIENSEVLTPANEEDEKYSSDIKKEVVFREKEMRVITVRKGDTLGKLAKRAYGNVMEYKRIYKANPEITRPDRIYIGQKIRIPLD